MEISANSEIIQPIIEHAKSIGFKNPFLNIASGSEKGDNYIGIIWKVKVEDHEDTSKYLNMIIKWAPRDPATRLAMSTHEFFVREAWFYQKLMPILKKIQCEKSEGPQCIFPECFMTIEENEKECLALEDMSLKGFILHRPRLATLDSIHVKVALTSLAHFHALSFVLKSRNPKLFNELGHHCTDTLFPRESKPFKSYLERASREALAVITNKYHYEKVEKFCRHIYENLEGLVVPNQYSVFCHGDYWKNNILFKYKDGLPVEVCPLDYQILRLSSPATDILYLLLCCTSHEERNLHYHEYLHHYHKELSNQFSKYGLDANIFSLADFLSEINRCGPYGLGMAMMVMIFMTCSSDNVPEASDIVGKKTVVDDAESLALFNDRIKGTIEDCIHYGFI